MRNLIVSIVFLFLKVSFNYSQSFTQNDTLKGSITKERIWWDLQHYDLKVKVDPKNKFISGSNIITYKVLHSYQVLQIDLQYPMKITRVVQNKKDLSFKNKGNAHFIQLKDKPIKGSTQKITIYFEGNPKIAVNPPWDGGFTWKKDKNQNDFIATSNQNIGASVWWPCKDHPFDEPDKGVLISITNPKNLIDVSNGKLIKTVNNKNGTKTFTWKVVNPINSYSININIGDYVKFSEIYKGEKGNLQCDYYVLSYNLDKAKKQFKQVPKMLKAFEYWFGPYPFYEDGYKLVEAPYLGMEHQSSVTYGNKYKNGYLGSDLSRSGWGLKFDFIIIHESGHEWFANSITNKDVADMWLHEGFTTYSEVLYLDYHFGTKAGNEYAQGLRKLIKNDKPIIGTYNVDHTGSSDMYPKGAAIIHMIRQLIDNDKEFRNILRRLNKKYYHQTVSSESIEKYISKSSRLDLTMFFNQYLRTIKIPVLNYKILNRKLKFKYSNTIKNYSLPVKIIVNNKKKWIIPNGKWQEVEFENDISSFSIDPNFYLNSKKVK